MSDTSNMEMQVEPTLSEETREEKEPRKIHFKKGQLMAVGTGGNVARWGEDGSWEEMGKLDGWSLKQIAFNMNGEMWCVGTGSNVGKYDPNSKEMKDMGNWGGWSINCLAFDFDDKTWVVGDGGHVAIWNEAKNRMDPQGNDGFLDGWIVRSLTFDPSGQMWCVSDMAEVGKYDPVSKKMKNMGNLGGWSINYLAFDAEDNLLAIGTGGNVGQWEGSRIILGEIQGGKFVENHAYSTRGNVSLTYNYPMEIVDVQYDIKKMKTKKGPKQVGTVQILKNNTDVEQEQTMEISDVIIRSSTFSWENATTVGFEMTTKTGVPKVGEVEFKLSVENTYTFGESETNESQQSWTWTNPVKVPARSQVTGIAKMNQGTITIPYTATVSYKGKKLNRNGTYTGTDSFNLDVTLTQDPLS